MTESTVDDLANRLHLLLMTSAATNARAVTALGQVLALVIASSTRPENRARVIATHVDRLRAALAILDGDTDTTTRH